MILRLTLRSARSHVLRFVLTTFAVFIGVSFITTAYGLADQLRGILDEETSTASQAGDISDVPGADRLLFVSPEVTSFGLTSTLDASLAEEIRSVDGVATAFGQTQRGVSFDVPGQATGSLGEFEAAATTSAYDEAQWRLVDGTAPTGPDQVAVNADGLSAASLTTASVGDSVSMFLPTGRRQMTISGVVESRTPESSNPFQFTTAVAVFDPAVSQSLFGSEGRVDSIVAVVAPESDAAAAKERIADVLPDGVTVGDAADLTAQAVGLINTIVDAIETGMLVFAGITLFVGTFLVANTFSIVVAQRTRELAVLRAVGAGRRQVFASVVGEAAVIGVIASLLGLIAGLLLAALAGWAIDTERSFGVIASGRTVGVALGIGMGVTMVSAIFPALRATRVAPVAAMHDHEVGPPRASWWGPLMGVVGVGGGIGAIVVGLGNGVSTAWRIGLIGGGAIAMFLALAGLSRFIAAPAVRMIGAPLGSGPVATLARTNAARNPRRTATTAGALMIGLALIALVATVGLSVRQGLENQLRNDTTATWFVQPNQFVPPDPTALVDALARPTEVASVVTTSFATITVDGPDGTSTGVAVADLAEVPTVYDLGITDGGTDTSGVWVSSDAARDLGVSVGDQVTLSTGVGADVRATVGAIYTRTAALSTILVDQPLADELGAQIFVQAVAIRGAEGFTDEQVRTAIKPATDDFASSAIVTPEDYTESQTTPLNWAVRAVAALLLVSVMVAGLGVANTLALSVYERTREIGLLRAVGATRRQIRKAVRREAVITSIFGGLLGVAVGTSLGVAAVNALPDAFSGTLVIPWAWIIGCILVTVFMGLGAALWPAWRAARMNVLEAIAHE
ncbi:MAG: FtsX-like permease family protein [Microthrixaceae bacterium]